MYEPIILALGFIMAIASGTVALTLVYSGLAAMFSIFTTKQDR